MALLAIQPEMLKTVFLIIASIFLKHFAMNLLNLHNTLTVYKTTANIMTSIMRHDIKQ